MKRLSKITIILAFFAVLVVALTLTACNPDVPGPDTPDDPVTEVTVTVDFGLEGTQNVLFKVKSGSAFYNELKDIVVPISAYEFDGYELDGAVVTAQTLAPARDFTVNARWLVSYKTEHYKEQSDGSFLRDEAQTQTFKSLWKTDVTVQPVQIEGYVFDPSIQGTLQSAQLNDNGVVLKLYYKRAQFTLAFDKGLALSATGETNAVSALFGDVVTLPENGFVSQTATFVCYNTSADNGGTSYNAGDEIIVTSDVTLYAVWQAKVTQKVWLETDDASGFVQGDDIEFFAVVGSTASSRNPDESKFALDPDHEGGLVESAVSETGVVLTSYFELRTFTVTYTDDGFVQTAKWGTEITVRTPTNDDPQNQIVSYCTSETGDGRDYPFGSKLTLYSDVTLYPVLVQVFTDDAGSGDTVRVRNNVQGLGAAVLVRDGKEYEGWLNVTQTADGAGDIVEFEVLLDDETYVFGRLYQDDDSQNKFVYRSEEFGVYLFLDPLYYNGTEYGNVIPNIMLTLDGYGTGVLALPEEGTLRTKNYYCSYKLNESGDYYLGGVFPSTGEQVEMYFALLMEPVDLGEGLFADGYFMERGTEGYYTYVYYYNRQIVADYMFQPDGYGNAKLYHSYIDPETEREENELVAEGIYYFANYADDSDPEMVFLSKEGESFYFILSELGEQYPGMGIFMIRHNEQGDYVHADGYTPSTLYLDGYGGAWYSADGSTQNERTGFYTVSVESETECTIVIAFIDDESELALRVNLNQHTFSLLESGFVIDEKGVLTDYVGTSVVIEIPEGVTEIASDVFKDKHIVSVTFPSTLRKIGDHAFEDSSADGASVLNTAIFKSQTPPELGQDVFRWIKGNFKIFVPDGNEEIYRKAFASATPSQPDGYAKFVTSNAEQSIKPEFEVENGVLVGYNNKQSDPSNVSVVIPDGVTAIADNVFANRDYIVSVNLNGVTVIGNEAFLGCSGLRTVIFNNVQSIGESAFSGCALTEISLGNVSSIGSLAFARNYSLTRVTLGEVQTIANRAFYECGRIQDETGEQVTPLDFIVTFTGTVPPTLVGMPFDGVLQLRVYVDSYETGIAFAQGNNWARYATALRVKAAQTTYWYSLTGAAEVLEMGDRVMFNETYFGLYKTIGDTIYISWFDHSELTQEFVVEENILTKNGDELIGADFSEFGNDDRYVFVKQGVTYTYTNGDETLQITFGSEKGYYCGDEILFDYSNYRTRFTYNGYVYTVTLALDGTFTYTKQKIEVVTTYTASDGSTLTVRDGNYVTANGVLKNVDGNGLEKQTETWGWYLTKVDPNLDNVYQFSVYHLNLTYKVVVYLDTDAHTFTYESSLNSQTVVYSNDDGTKAVVTVMADGTFNSIHLLFATSNSVQEFAAEIQSVQGNTYVVTVNKLNADGTPSEFNGEYTLTFDLANKSFTYGKN